MSERENLERAIAALEAQRSTLGDAVVDSALGPLRDKLAKLESSGAQQQRKQATVLLADVSNFTRMAETMDAEEIGDVINTLWQIVDAIIIAHGGLIDKHIGDAVMALWGVDQAREDDSERAIRAALAMQQKVAELDIRPIHSDQRLQLALRIGVNTGPVLLGDVGTMGEFSAMGDAVNLVSRLERTAPVGGVLISHDTYRHVRGLFDVLSQEPVAVKGKVEPVQTYVVLRAKPRAFRVRTRGVEGIETRMVGRDADLLALQDALRDVLASSTEDTRTRVVTIVGDAGVGKSRLLYEFDNWIELLPTMVLYFKGRATPEMQTIPYSIIRDMFAYRFEIRESDSAATVMFKFRAGMADVLDPDQADLVGHLVGFDFRQAGSQAVQNLLGSPSFQQLALAYLGDYVRAIANEPSVVFLEDIHWADDSSLDMFDRLVDKVPGARLLIVCLARPEFFERRPDWGVGSEPHTRIELAPLCVDSSRALVGQILHKMDVLPNVLRDLVVKGAEGNPYYVEELIKMLIEDGVIVRGEERWQTDLGRLTEVRVPPTLTEVLQARLDSLPRDEKVILQRASVVGRLFWNATVTELMSRGSDEVAEDKVNALLDAIRGRELVFQRERSTFEGTDEYIFKHAVLRDVTYETVLLKLRRVYHAQVAKWLEDNAGERLNEYLGLIAMHYERAGDDAKAVAYLIQVGQEALNVLAYRDAIVAYERALSLLPEEQTLSLLPEEPASSSSDSSQAQSDDAESRTLLLNGLGVAHRLMGTYPLAVQYLERGLALARARDDKNSMARALYDLGDVAYRRGEDDAAEKYARESLTIYQELDNQQGIASALKVLGFAFALRCEMEDATRYYEKSRTIAQKSGNRALEGVSLISLGEAARNQRQYAQAIRYYEESLVIYKEVGNRAGMAIARNNLGVVCAGLGENETSWGYLREALGESWSIGSIFVTVEALSWLALLYARAGQAERAAELMGLVLDHPSLSEPTRREIIPILDMLRGLLPAAQLDAALERGRELDLAQVVAEVLAETR